MENQIEHPKQPRKRYGPRKATAKRRQDILEAAMQVFAAKGSRAGTLSDVAELAGMTHAGVLHHFGSKDNLLRAVLNFRDDSRGPEVRAAYGIDFFRHLITTAEQNATRPGIVQTYVVLSAEAVTEDNPGVEYFTDRYQGLREMIFSQIRELSPAANPLSDDELRLATSNIIALMDGLQVQWLLSPDAVNLVQGTVFGIDAILRRVAAGNSGDPMVTLDQIDDQD